MEPAVLRPARGGVEVEIIVTPHARTNEVGKIDPWRKRLAVKVTAPPTEGRANEAVCELLSEFFGVRATLVHGATDRQKTIFLPLTADEARKKLEGAGARF